MPNTSSKARWKDRWKGRAKASFGEKTRERVGKIWSSVKKSPGGSPLPTARPSSTSPRGSSSQLGPPHLQPSLSPQISTLAASLHSNTSQENALLPLQSTSVPSTSSLEPSPVVITSPSVEDGEVLSSPEVTGGLSPSLDIEDIHSPPAIELLTSTTIKIPSVSNSNGAPADWPLPSNSSEEKSQSTTSSSSASCHGLSTVTITAPSVLDAVDVSPTAAIEPSPPPTSCPETASTLSLNLWEEVFRNVNDETNEWIKQHGLNSTPNLDSNDQVKALIDLLQNQSLLHNTRMPTKISIGNQKIVLREYVADVVKFLTMAGDLTATLVPRETSAPWAAGKALLKIPVQRADQMAALAATIQWFTRIIRRGQVYELLYKASTTDGEAVSNLHSALLDLYIAAMEFLARSDKLVRGGKAGQTLEVLLRPQQTADFLSDLLKKEQKVQLEAQACELSRQAKAHQKLDQGLQSVLARLEELSPPPTRTDDGLTKLLEEVDKDRLEKVMDFISSEKFGRGHATIRDTRTPGTGDWLIQHEGFRDWQSIPSSSTVLCLKGTVGTGKTYLTSRVIDYIRGTLETSAHDEGFAFYYCNRSGPSMQDPLTVLRSLARQLSYKAFNYGRIQKNVIQRYELALHEGRDFGYRDCRELILDSLNLYPKTTIILDALDESDITTYNLAEILLELVGEASRPVKLFVSSRPDREYMDAFDTKSTITVDFSNQRGDIEKFLHEKLYSTRFFRNRRAEIQHLIQDTFTAGNGGMQVAQHHRHFFEIKVLTLKPCVTDDAVRLWAKTIPPDLMGAYDQLWADIKAQHNVHDVALAERAVQWVLCSIEPVSTKILLEAIRYAFDGDTLVQKEEQHEQEILALCQDLLTVDGQKQVWTLPHASVAEYFESKGMFVQTCDAFAARTSLEFLMQFKWSVRQGLRYSGPRRASFEEYAAYAWPQHVQRYDEWLGSAASAEADEKLVRSLKRFLGSPKVSSVYFRNWVESLDFKWDGQKELLPMDMALFTMCRYGFYHVFPDWWNTDEVDEEMALEKCKDGCNSLVLAVKAESAPICSFLVRVMNVDNALAEGHHPAMRAALHRDNKDIISLLVLEGKVDINILVKDRHPSHSLVQLAIKEHPHLVPWLLEQGWVDVNREGGDECGNALIAAVYRDRPQLVRILLKAGADANAAVECGDYGSALVAAASTIEDTRLEMMQLLVKHGADPNLPLKGGRYGSPLEALLFIEAMNLYPDVPPIKESVEFLLAAGEDPAMMSDVGRHGSALAAAAWYGFKDMLALMVAVTGRERAVECLGRSRHPWSGFDHNRERYVRWTQRVKEIVPYLTDDLGLSHEMVYGLGLWLVGPEEVGSYTTFFSYH
ncbi:hypothetical protein CCMA1212_003058 [Trichoderma ghanense]|uniref:Nephrocystin 3-like N-terminal domain-containing protein n=1 Tax=Trichoderma ghanense TaxID=65468 RepID=A0ABY2H9T2_9HYPO